ncbi:unnamed protein product [Bursaphelenchus okinawaensis]|uniref:Uncharacterized protein n=1 Tax=Bursaphelenchus okinawaensis TaxID=465554 RepID=A0A811KQP9_9BILA|nr:unnamed protein product [Bursaphelenchus okinawaensis]CAG9111867.1 unnamed protein product [Bursaphelenchus okinawaensis]
MADELRRKMKDDKKSDDAKQGFRRETAPSQRERRRKRSSNCKISAPKDKDVKDVVKTDNKEEKKDDKKEEKKEEKKDA